MRKTTYIAIALIFSLLIGISTTFIFADKYISQIQVRLTNLNNCTVSCSHLHTELASSQNFCMDRSMMFETEETLLKKFGNYSKREWEKVLNRKVHLIAYGNDRFNKSKRRLHAEAEKYGLFSTISIYEPADLCNVFRGYFQNVLDQRRGGGYWIWKFYAIRDALEKANEGEYVFYLDSGSSILPKTQNRFWQYLLMLERSNYSFLAHNSGPYKEEYFISGPLISLFGLRNEKKFLDSVQISAAFILMKKNSDSIRLLDIALKILHLDQNLVTDFYGNCCTTPTFKENRHDQSIFSVLFKCNGFVWLDETYRDKCKKGIACITRKRE